MESERLNTLKDLLGKLAQIDQQTLKPRQVRTSLAPLRRAVCVFAPAWALVLPFACGSAVVIDIGFVFLCVLADACLACRSPACALCSCSVVVALLD